MRKRNFFFGTLALYIFTYIQYILVYVYILGFLFVSMNPSFVVSNQSIWNRVKINNHTKSYPAYPYFVSTNFIKVIDWITLHWHRIFESFLNNIQINLTFLLLISLSIHKKLVFIFFIYWFHKRVPLMHPWTEPHNESCDSHTRDKDDQIIGKIFIHFPRKLDIMNN